QHVFVVKPDKTVEVRPVTLGSTNEGEAVIAKGLAAGERVVREGQFLLGPESRIEIKDSTKVVVDETKSERRRVRDGKGKGKADDKRGES
ncbi:MAG: efflux RND transporter periplasmic adaptor subunit, partial [Acidimicrobiia bacterium]